MVQVRRWKKGALLLFCIGVIFLKLQLMDGSQNIVREERTMVDSRSIQEGHSLDRHDNSRLHASRIETHRSEQPKRRRVRLTVRLHLPNVTMNKSLGDRSSDQYKQLSEQLSSDIERLFADTPGTQRVYNMRFSPYSGKKTARPHKSRDRNSHSSQPENLRTRFDIISQSVDFSEATEIEPDLSTERPPANFHSLISPSSSSSISERGQTEIKEEILSPAVPSLKTVIRHHKSKVAATKTAHVTATVETASAPPPESSLPLENDKFNVQRLTRLFKESYVRSGKRGEYNILMERYINAYSELLGIFQFLGPIFSWAGDDAKSKLAKLSKLREEDLAASTNRYETLQSMFAYEYSSEGEPNGVATNKWIHLALKFISDLVKAIAEPSQGESMSAKVKEIYDNTLAPHHDWLTRMGVYLALLSFPSRDTLMPKIGVSDNAQGRQSLLDLASVVDAVFEDVQKLYDKYTS